MNVYVVGCGGTGGWLATALAKMLTSEDTLVLMDKDVFEKHNRDRQLGCRIGTPKTDALIKYLRGSKTDFCSYNFYLGENREEEDLIFSIRKPEVIFCAADNHRARAETLRVADEYMCPAIICGNGFIDAEAYYYDPKEWYNGPLDPRVYYPEILEDHTGDPLSPPCTGEILESEPQLAIANMAAATYGLRLWYYWGTIRPKLTDEDAINCSVFHIKSTAGRTSQVRLRDMI